MIDRFSRFFRFTGFRELPTKLYMRNSMEIFSAIPSYVSSLPDLAAYILTLSANLPNSVGVILNDTDSRSHCNDLVNLVIYVHIGQLNRSIVTKYHEILRSQLCVINPTRHKLSATIAFNSNSALSGLTFIDIPK